MSKHPSPKSRDLKQHHAANTATNPGDTELPQDDGIVLDGPVQEGDGLILMTGSGIQKPPPASQRQALIAKATAGDANAQCHLAELCRLGEGLPEPDLAAEAMRLYKLAAEQGTPTALINLGEICGSGKGVSDDDLEEVGRLYLAAMKGQAEACSRLGTMHRIGDRVEKSVPRAAEFHVIAALEGNNDANLAEYLSEIEVEALKGSLLPRCVWARCMTVASASNPTRSGCSRG